jgi:hypothetical protein
VERVSKSLGRRVVGGVKASGFDDDTEALRMEEEVEATGVA